MGGCLWGCSWLVLAGALDVGVMYGGIDCAARECWCVVVRRAQPRDDAPGWHWGPAGPRRDSAAVLARRRPGVRLGAVHSRADVLAWHGGPAGPHRGSPAPHARRRPRLQAGPGQSRAAHRGVTCRHPGPDHGPHHCHRSQQQARDCHRADQADRRQPDRGADRRPDQERVALMGQRATC